MGTPATRWVMAALAVSLCSLEAQTEGPLRPRPRRPRSVDAGPMDAGRVDTGETTVLFRRSTSPLAAEGLTATDPHPDPLIEKAYEVNYSFTEGLPDFICGQRSDRFASFNLGRTWSIEDTVEAEVLYVDHEEHYRNIVVNGRRRVKRMRDLDRTWSTGEYGTILRNLFAPQLKIKFERKPKSDGVVAGAVAYAIAASEEQSTWSLSFAKHHARPAYTGTVWLAPESGRALRVEMHTESELPQSFPVRMVRTTLEFSPVLIDGREYLLPVSSEYVGCIRNSLECFNHKIAFADYRKFSAESSIFHTESEVEFEH